jgi:signal transduction histidine kinase
MSDRTSALLGMSMENGEPTSTVSTVDDLSTEALRREVADARRREAASAEILRLIGSSPESIQLVFEAIAKHAVLLCEAMWGGVFTFDGTLAHFVAGFGLPDAAVRHLHDEYPIAPRGINLLAITGRTVVHVIDALNDPRVANVELVRKLGYQSHLVMPMTRAGRVFGTIHVYGPRPKPFSETQVSLLQTFADQAVIAIENTRLFEAEQAGKRELQQSLDYQTATSEVLGAISRSPTELQPVLDTIARTSQRLCEADRSSVWRLVDHAFELAAISDYSPTVADYMTRVPVPADQTSVAGRCVLEKRTLHIHDRLNEPGLPPLPQSYATGTRTLLCVPLLREGEPIGVVRLSRDKVAPFTKRQIALVETFADQAVIAIENTRLFEAERASKRELQESLEYQTATSDVLGVIATSPTNIQPVLQTLVESACRLCAAFDAIILLREGDWLQVKAHHGPIPANASKRKITRDWVNGRCVADGVQIHVPDLQAEVAEYPEGAALAQRLGARTILSTPLMREREAIGAIMIRRDEVRPFSDKQIGLLETFADQAVIAIENTRLFEEVQARTRDLQEALEQQTATSEVLSVISSSPGDLKPVFQAMLENATRICDANFGVLQLYQGGGFRIGAIHNAPPAFAEAMARREPLMRPTPQHPFTRMVTAKAVVQIADLTASSAYKERDPGIVMLVERASARTFLAVPMLKESDVVGVIAIYRQEIRAFTDKQVAVVVNFANQAVIAIENIRLLNELRDSLRQLEIASQHKSQFVANMSHELRTPLAAILGYAELMQEGFYEPQGPKSLDALTRIRSNGKHLLGLINTVLDIAKIESGQFTLNMAEYDVQSIVETVRSATASLAQNKRLTLKTDVAKKLPIGLGDEQRLTQVLLNLVGNAIKFTDAGEVRVSAMVVNGAFAVSVADTGPGIPPDQLTRVFEQFHQVDSSNTKAKGGTGLGLAISKQIVEMHGGRIWVESTLGKGSVFHMELPTRAEFRKVAL